MSAPPPAPAPINKEISFPANNSRTASACVAVIDNSKRTPAAAERKSMLPPSVIVGRSRHKRAHLTHSCRIRNNRNLRDVYGASSRMETGDGLQEQLR